MTDRPDRIQKARQRILLRDIASTSLNVLETAHPTFLCESRFSRNPIRFGRRKLFRHNRWRRRPTKYDGSDNNAIHTEYGRYSRICDTEVNLKRGEACIRLYDAPSFREDMNVTEILRLNETIQRVVCDDVQFDVPTGALDVAAGDQVRVEVDPKHTTSAECVMNGSVYFTDDTHACVSCGGLLAKIRHPDLDMDSDVQLHFSKCRRRRRS